MNDIMSMTIARIGIITIGSRKKFEVIEEEVKTFELLLPTMIFAIPS